MIAAIQREAEELAFRQLLAEGPMASQAPVLFLLGSPRTGSTRLYQAVIRAFRLPYFSNLANDAFSEWPILVAPLQRQVQSSVEIAMSASFGKTQGAFQPSEASAIMQHWCGGGHPSEIVSAAVLPDKANHMARTIAAYHRLFDAPLVIKNAWHCFRIASLARFFPNARFLWVRRDITASALSDLASRYLGRGDPTAWNSATPANIEALRQMPYWAQVVENQFEFARAIETNVTAEADGRHAIVWFEDFVRDPGQELRRIATAFMEIFPANPTFAIAPGGREPSEKPFRPGDQEAVREYVELHRDRLQSCRYVPQGPTKPE